jgi:septal ring factor EnvC (AmiA/AmiB activator)
LYACSLEAFGLGAAIHYRHLFAALTLACNVCAAAAGPPAESPDAAEAKAKLAAVRERIARLTGRLGAELKERDTLGARLRDADLAITAKRLKLDGLNAAVAAAERQESELRAEETRTRAALDRERAALAAQVRTQYMTGRADELRLLLSQTNPGEVGRSLAYYGYFARARADKIAEVAAHETSLAELVQEIEQSSARLKSLKEDTSREVTGLVHARTERSQALAALSQHVESGNEELARLKKEEASVESLVADLERVLKDFPVDTPQRFDQMRGKLPWPVAGKLMVRYQETRTNGAPTAVRWNGVTIETSRGAKVRAPFSGRVVYADWLQGMGMLLIVAHSGNYMTLYGHAEVLYKSVGDWVAPGDVIAAVSDAGGPLPELYFEIRDGRTPVDPKMWLRSAQ